MGKIGDVPYNQIFAYTKSFVLEFLLAGLRFQHPTKRTPRASEIYWENPIDMLVGTSSRTLLGFVVEGDLLEIFYHGIHHHQIPPFGKHQAGVTPCKPMVVMGSDGWQNPTGGHSKTKKQKVR